MGKLIIGFILLASAALYLMSKGGDIDMGGERHGADAPAHPAANMPPVAAPTKP